jgi:type VI secretion system lysozyme-like protein
MTKIRRSEAGRALLFDRLCNDAPKTPERPEARPYRTYDRAQLRASVRRELQRLLDTRAPRSLAQMAGRPRTVIDYGVPEVTPYMMNNAGESGALAKFLVESITAFEPRLANVRVELVRAQPSLQRLEVRVDADLVAGRLWEPVSFELATGAGEVGAAGGPPADPAPG